MATVHGVDDDAEEPAATVYSVDATAGAAVSGAPRATGHHIAHELSRQPDAKTVCRWSNVMKDLSLVGRRLRNRKRAERTALFTPAPQSPRAVGASAPAALDEDDEGGAEEQDDAASRGQMEVNDE